MSGLNALDIPQRFVLPKGDQYVKDDIKVLSGNIWEVFSDRTYNKTTSKPGGGSVFKIIQYLDRFYVTEIKKRYLHLVRDPSINSDGIFSNQSEDFGWIPMENLLLWKHCLIDDNERNKRVFIFRNKETETFFKGVENDKKKTPDYFQVLYILKEEKDRSLLAKSVRLFGEYKTLDENILGWVDNNRFVHFSSNIFAQPSQSGKVQTSPILNPVFFDKRSVLKARSKDNINLQKVLWNNSGSQELAPTIFRFPIKTIKDSIASVLVYSPDVLYQTGYFSIELESNNKFYNGYCSLSTSNKEFSYDKVLLLSKSELAYLMDASDKLLQLYDGSFDTLTIASEIRNLFHLKQSVTNTSILGSSLTNLIFNKFGCHETILNNSDIIRDIFFNEKQRYFNYFQKIKENLRASNSIYNNKSSNNYFISNGIQYYWILCSCFP